MLEWAPADKTLRLERTLTGCASDEAQRPLTQAGEVWSSTAQPVQSDINEVCEEMVPRGGIEPPTLRFSVVLHKSSAIVGDRRR